MWPGSMHDGPIWKDCDLLESFMAQNCLTAGCKPTSAAVTCSQHTCKPSHGALLWCSGQDTYSISIWQDTDIKSNVPAVTSNPVLHGHVKCIKNRAQKTNK
ncbi:uncharacterized protein LOC142814684 [Rhipicephalus microplus]|uniref:uncharacterized protein LOC142814684 n=1 Tax=Rhipicephalus microplus TaxID=6941 RepID=UPI003F6C73BE